MSDLTKSVLSPRPRSAEAPAGLPASDLAGRIAAGEITARAAVEAHIARLERINPALNAAVVKLYERARALADAADARQRQGLPLGPLHGVPLTVKECFDVADTPSTFGLAARAGHRASADDAYVARLLAAGAIPIAKTNVAQLLFFYETENPVYGRTLHPERADRSPGGSSGGEAALIAAGASALGLGTDLGGSVRVPAAFAGIAGFKATAGRFPDPGRGSVPWGQRAIPSQAGVLGWGISDVTLGLRALEAGRDPAVDPGPALGDPAAVEVAGLRVACFEEDGVFPASPAVRRAVREAAEALRRRGATVVPWSLPDGRRALELSGALLFGDNGEGFRALLGREKPVSQLADLIRLSRWPDFLRRGLGAALRAFGQTGMADNLGIFGHRTAAEYWRNVEAQADYRAAFARALDQVPGGPCDAVLCPPCALPAYTHGASREVVTAGCYALLFNLLGWPAGVVPCTRVRRGEESDRPASKDRVAARALEVERGSAGLPIGVQIAARPWREDIALALLAAVEREAPTGLRPD